MSEDEESADDTTWELVDIKSATMEGPPGSVHPSSPERAQFLHSIRTYRLRVPSGYLYRVDTEAKSNTSFAFTVGNVVFVPDPNIGIGIH